MIKNNSNVNIREFLQQQAVKIGLKSRQTIDVISLIKSTVTEVLQAELKNGNYNEVISFLKNSSLKVGRELLVDKITQRVVSGLIIRFGLPHSVAMNVAMLVVPFILKRLAAKALKSGKVQDLLQSLGINDQLDKFQILKNQLKDKFNFRKAA